MFMIATLALTLSTYGSVRAATASNAQSPLGANLNGVSYWSSEQPFLNIFKTAPTWHTKSKPDMADTGEEAYLQLDSSGYPITLIASASDPHSPQLFTYVESAVLVEVGRSNAGTSLPFRSGNYAVLYDGQGTMTYGLDAKLVSRSAGQDIINVANPGGGIGIYLKATDPRHTGDYIRNIRLVYQEEAKLLSAGNVFEPAFLSLLKNFHVLRFMDWLATNNSVLSSWTSRPLQTDATWASNRGVPIEVALQLCNAVGADCWLNVPHRADDNYITQMAKLAHSMLGTGEKIYIEFSNEVWNSDFAQHQYATAQGQAMWLNAGAGADYEGNWYGMRVAQMCDIWKSVWGADFPRVTCVMGAQAATTSVATQALRCPLWTGSGNAPCSNHGIGAVAIAPYFGNFNAQPSWTSASDGGLSNLFQALNGGDLQQTSNWEASYQTALAPYKLPFIAYEGGQSFVGFPAYQNGSPIVNLYIAANRDPRMGAAYTTALNNWKTNGGQIYMVFVDVASPSKYGEWGALENLWDTVSPLTRAPTKWQAIQNFITLNSCWWAGCARTIGTAAETSPILTVR